jgi:hypothetical protein
LKRYGGYTTSLYGGISEQRNHLQSLLSPA